MFGSKKSDFDGVFDDGFSHVFQDSKGSMGLNKDKTKIALANKEKTKIYTREEIRGHQSVFDGGADMYGAGVGQAIHESLRAKRATGFFIRAKDIENPVWAIPVKDEHLQNVWNEILQQWYDGEL